MKQFDKELKERAKNEPFPLPEDYAGRFAIAGSGHDFAEIDRVVRNTHKILLLC